MDYKIPRIMIAGTGSGCGKTTVTCAVLKAIANRERQVSAFKCGPDYIDPMFHEHILGKPSTNLDSYFFSENTLKWLLAKNGTGKGINLIEGVMGFYDGLGIDSSCASSYDISQITNTPVILVVNAKGSALSTIAVIKGFLDFRPGNQIRGVILNQCSAMTYSILSKAIRNYFEGEIQPLGFLPPMSACSLESRHLGLVTAREIIDLDEKIEKLAGQAEQTIDLDGIMQIAEQTSVISCEPVHMTNYPEKVRIAVARDSAFCFYYHDNLDLLKEIGAELVYFSPLDDSKLPRNIQGLYLGGGYPELYKEKLSGNVSMLDSVHNALSHNLPCIAECGGFMYLTEAIDTFKMVGYIPETCYNNQKLTRFGYVQLKANRKNMLCEKGLEMPAHEFHYWDCENPGNDFSAEKTSGRRWNCVYANEHLYAGFPHFHFYANPDFAVHFYEACLKFKENAHA